MKCGDVYCIYVEYLSAHTVSFFVLKTGIATVVIRLGPAFSFIWKKIIRFSDQNSNLKTKLPRKREELVFWIYPLTIHMPAQHQFPYNVKLTIISRQFSGCFPCPGVFVGECLNGEWRQKPRAMTMMTYFSMMCVVIRTINYFRRFVKTIWPWKPKS